MTDKPIASLLPHAGSARLLDRLLRFGMGRLEAETVIREDTAFSEPDGTLMPWVGAELMAQAVSAFSAASRGDGAGPPRIGLLLGVRDYDCNLARFTPGMRVIVTVHEATRDDRGMGVFDCSLIENGCLVAKGTLTAFEPADVRPYLQGMPA